MADQGFQAQTNGIGIRRSSARLLRGGEKFVVDIEGLLHTGIYTI